MKTLLTMLMLVFSAKSMAHVCHISLYDPYGRPYLNFHSTLDQDCQQAANSCYQSIADRRLDPNQFKCYTVSMTNDPQTARPVAARPVPGAIQPADRDYLRDIEMGETVIYQGKLWLSSTPMNGLYDLIPEGGKKKDMVERVPRREIAITRGCLRNICTKSSVISRSTQNYMAVEGIDYNGRYILKNVSNRELTLNVDFMYLVRTEGCINNGFGEVCVGNTVQDRNYRYFEVVGIQSEGMVVVKDQNQKLYFSIDPRGLGVTN